MVVNLAPADLPKDAASFDLPIALGTLIGSGQIASEMLAQYAVVGELALDGTTRPTKGALSMAMAAAEDKTLRGLIVPAESAAEAAVGGHNLLMLGTYTRIRNGLRYKTL